MHNNNKNTYGGTATIWFKSNIIVYLLTAAHCIFKFNEVT